MAIRFVTKHPETKQKVLDFVEEWNNSSEEICVKTSGSTGLPKEIRIRKEYMIASALATGKFLNLSKGNTALLCLSMDTIGGRMMVVRTLVLELNLIVSDISSTPLSDIDEDIDFAAMVPLQVQQSMDRTHDKIASIQKLIIGGGPVSNELIDSLQGIPTKAYHTFGMTETISHIAMRSLNHPLEKDFKCLPGIEIRLENGSLVISAEKIGVQNLITNDAVELTSPRSFRWLGRTDFVINSGGIKLHPEEIESKLSRLIDVPFFVYGEEDQLLGHRLVLMIEYAVPLKLKKDNFRKLLAKYAVPKEIRYVTEFIYTKSEKINRLETIKLANVAHEVL